MRYIVYNTTGGLNVNDLTWSVGTTLTPDPDTSLTVSYGHLNGYNSLSVNGHYTHDRAHHADGVIRVDHRNPA